MDEEIQAELTALQNEISQQELLISQLQAKLQAKRPSSERFAEQFSIGETLGGVWDSAAGLVQGPIGLAKVAAKEAVDNPLKTITTLGANTLADPIGRAVASHVADVGTGQAAIDISKGVASILPGGRTLAESAEYLGKTGEVPPAEEVGKWAQAELGPALVGGAIGAAGKVLPKVADAALGVSPERMAKTLVEEGQFSAGMAGATRALNSRAMYAQSQAADAMAAADDFAALKDPISGNSVILQADRSAAGAEGILKATERARAVAGKERESLLKGLDAKAFEANRVLPNGSPSVGTVSFNDINLERLASRLETYPEDIQQSILGSVSEVLEDFKVGDGIKRGMLPSGLSLTDTQKAIQKIDARLSQLGAYNDAEKAQYFQFNMRSPDADIVALKEVRGAIQEALRKKIGELANGGVTDPSIIGAYENYNKQIQAAHAYEPLLKRAETEAVAGFQSNAPGSLNTAVTNVRGTIVDAVGNPESKRAAETLRAQAAAVKRMQDLIRFREGQQLDLLPRTWEAAQTSARANMVLANIAMQIGAPFNTPAEKKAVYTMAAQMFPQEFEAPISGLSSELDGKITNPIEADYYLQENFDKLADNPTARAEVLGPFVSLKKVAGASQATLLPQPPSVRAIELFPQLDGGFAMQQPTSLQGVDADLMSFVEGQRAKQIGY